MDHTTRQNNRQTTSKIPHNTNLQLEPDTNGSFKSISVAVIPDNARGKLKELLYIKYTNIVSQTTPDIGRTYLIQLHIPTEGLPIAPKPYTVPLKYHEFVDHKIKLLEETGIISWSMSNWARSRQVIPKKEDCVDASAKTNTNTNKNSKFNLRLCIDYRKLNSRMLTVHQIKTDSSLG